jgi:Tfp pilus assembly protein FimV
MKHSRKSYFFLLALAFFHPEQGRGQMAVAVVSDPIAQFNHSEEIAKWVESIQKLNTQIDQMRQYVQIAETVKGYIGDPLSAAGAIGLDLLDAGSLGNSVGQLTSELNRTVSGVQALQNDSQGLFSPIQFKTPSGFDLNFQDGDYKSFAALQKQTENVGNVISDTLRKITQLQQDKATTLAQLKTASQQSEVQKLQAKLESIDGEIAALNQQQATAQTQLMAQDIANQNQRTMQAQAATEAANQEMTVSLENYAKWQGQLSRSKPEFK